MKMPMWCCRPFILMKNKLLVKKAKTTTKENGTYELGNDLW